MDFNRCEKSEEKIKWVTAPLIIYRIDTFCP